MLHQPTAREVQAITAGAYHRRMGGAGMRRGVRGPRGGAAAPAGNPYDSPATLGWNLWLASGWNAGTGILTATAGAPNLQQTTGSKQPASVEISGRTYLRPDGVDDFLESATTVDRTGVGFALIWAGRRRAACPTNGIAFDRHNFTAPAAAQINLKIAASATSAANCYVLGDVGLNGWTSTALPDDTDMVIGVTYDKSAAAAGEIARFERDGASIKDTQSDASNNAAGMGDVVNYWFMRGGVALPGEFDWFGAAEISGNPSNDDMAEATNWFRWELGLI